MNVSGEFPSLQLHVPAMLSTQPLAFKKLNNYFNNKKVGVR